VNRSVKKLLTPIDPLNKNDSLIKTVVTLAKQLRAEVHVLVALMHDDKRVIGFETAEEYAKFFREQGIETTCELVRLDGGRERLAATIAEIAKEYDMVIMGHHKFNRMYRFLRHSTAQDVINMVSCPVAVVPG